MPPRRSKKKLKLMAAESGEDRISALSDRVIHRVLSFLPADEAVQTCLISRRWLEVWKSMPVLRFDGFEYIRSTAEFNKFVNHFLFFRDLAPLEEFNLRLRDAEFLFFRDLAPFSVLDGCSMDFSRCPLLEDLEIKRCRISAHKMSSQSIRRLRITSCEFSDDTTRLQIFVPNLFAIGLSSNTGLTPFLGSMPLLVTAIVELWHRSSSLSDRCRHTNYGEYCGLDPCIGCYGSEKCVVLEGLSNATSLQFRIEGSWSSENILKRDLKWCSPFSKLKTLVLNDRVVGLSLGDVRGLICFLQRTPILEKLVLKIYDELRHVRKIDESCILVEQFIPSKHLEIVEVSCSKAVKNVDKLVETMIASGISRDIISIRRSDS